MNDEKFLVKHLCYAVSKQTAAYRLHRSLLSIGISSVMGVGSKSIDGKDIYQPKTLNDKLSALFGLSRELLYKKAIRHNNIPYFSFNVGPTLIQKAWIDKMLHIKSDITHLHWIGNGFLPLSKLAEINNPIVWTMHDTWAFTGGCHINNDCENYRTSCEQCPQLKTTRSNKIAYHLLKSKEKIYRNIDFNIITPSSFMKEKVENSRLFHRTNIHVIPNALNLDEYKPLNKEYSRHVLNVKTEKKVIAFGAISATSDFNKGYDLLLDALRKITQQRNDLMVIVFGSDIDKQIELDIKCEIKFIPRLHDDISLAIIYSAADVTIVPSRQESYSQVSAESIACGTPVIAFDSSGPKDFIQHQYNGYLAKSFNTDDLVSGITWILENDERRQQLSENARKKALSFCCEKTVANQHLKLYESLI